MTPPSGSVRRRWARRRGRGDRAGSEGLGADVVVEAAGSPGALDAALRLARGRGTVSVVGAHFEPDFPLDNHLMFERELTLRFSIGDAAGHRQKLLELIRRGRLDPASVVSTACRWRRQPRRTGCSTRARRRRW